MELEARRRETERQADGQTDGAQFVMRLPKEGRIIVRWSAVWIRLLSYAYISRILLLWPWPMILISELDWDILKMSP